jgi:hypothetical protein
MEIMTKKCNKKMVLLGPKPWISWFLGWVLNKILLQSHSFHVLNSDTKIQCKDKKILELGIPAFELQIFPS